MCAAIRKVADIPKGYERKRIIASVVEELDLNGMSVDSWIEELKDIKKRSNDKAYISCDIDDDNFGSLISITASWKQNRLESDQEFMQRVRLQEQKKKNKLRAEEREKKELKRLLQKYRNDM